MWGLTTLGFARSSPNTFPTPGPLPHITLSRIFAKGMGPCHLHALKHSLIIQKNRFSKCFLLISNVLDKASDSQCFLLFLCGCMALLLGNLGRTLFEGEPLYSHPFLNLCKNLYVTETGRR
jgi:hypothetical protein